MRHCQPDRSVPAGRVEHPVRLGHASSVSIRSFQRSLNRYFRRPPGQLVGFLLVLCLVLSGIPSGEIHAHVDGDHGHAHGMQLGSDTHPGHEVPAADSDGAAFHVHEACTTTSTLPEPAALLVSALPPAQVEAALVVWSPPSLDHIPPDRPPIV